MSTLTLYGNNISGYTYKSQLTASLLGINYDYKETDLLAGELKSPDFLKINPLGQVPTIVIDHIHTAINPTTLLESNAISYYIAQG